MSELNDLLTTRELQRWRLILGEAAETTLCGLDDNARQIDHALEWLYGRDPERLQRGERSGGLGGSNLTTPEWINSIHTLFPQQVIERLESDAVLRYGIEDVVTNLDVLERMQPSEKYARLWKKLWRDWPVSREYLALPDGPGRFAQDSSCPALLRIPLCCISLHILDYHRLWSHFPKCSVHDLHTMSRSYNPSHALRRHWFGLFPVRSPLLGESFIYFLFLQVLRCFSSLR